jgi:hypothetical protein
VPSAPFLRVETGTHGSVVNRMSVDPNGRFFVTVSDDKTVRFWALPDGRPIAVLRVPIADGDEGALHAAALSPDGRRLLVGGATCATWDRAFCLYLFDVTTQQLSGRLPNLPAVVNHVAFSPDGKRFAVALGGRAGVKLYDAGNGRVVGEDASYADRTTWVAFAPDGRFATASFDGYVRLYDAAGRRTHDHATPGRRPYSVAFSPDGGALAVGYLRQSRVDVLDGRDLRPRASPPDPSVPEGSFSVVAWGPDATLYAAGTARHAGGMYVVRRWPAGTGAPTDVAAARDTLTALAPLADGSVIFGSADPRVGRIDAAGRVLFSVDRAGLDFRDVTQRTLAASNDGLVVDFHTRRLSPGPCDFRLDESDVSAGRRAGRPRGAPRAAPSCRSRAADRGRCHRPRTRVHGNQLAERPQRPPFPRHRRTRSKRRSFQRSASATADAHSASCPRDPDYYVRVYDGAEQRTGHWPPWSACRPPPAGVWSPRRPDGLRRPLGDGTLPGSASIRRPAWRRGINAFVLPPRPRAWGHLVGGRPSLDHARHSGARNWSATR